MSASSAEKVDIIIRSCSGLNEYEACVEIQRDVWGFEDADVIPTRMFVVASKIGGQIIGAFDHNVLVGFALSIPGMRNGKPYLHSHMLAVRDAYRNAGLGRGLKLAQRDDALRQGYELMEWTFDPLEIKNSYLNLEKLGAIARRYSHNHYGFTSSQLQGGLPTDRLVAEWWLRSERVERVLRGERPVSNASEIIPVPADIYEWKANPEHRDKALNAQTSIREQFESAISRGLAALGYSRDAAGNGAFLLGRWDEDWGYGPAH